jgi:hypothetical protein
MTGKVSEGSPGRNRKCDEILILRNAATIRFPKSGVTLALIENAKNSDFQVRTP